MPLSTTAHNRMLDAVVKGEATTVTLLTTTTLAVAASAGDTSVKLNRPVAAGDYVSLNDNGTREVFEVESADGTTATLADGATVQNAHGVNSSVGVAPKNPDDIARAEAGTERVAISWKAATGEAISADTGTDIKFAVEPQNEIGGFAIFDGDTLLGSFLTGDIEGFGAAGTYLLTTADVRLSS